MRCLAPIGAGLLAALVGCSDSPEAERLAGVGAPQFAVASTVNQITPFGAVTANPCTGEDVLVTGDLHSKFHLTLQPDLSVNTETTVNTQNTQAVGLVTGARYVAKEEFSQAFQSIGQATSWKVIEADLHMVRSGETGLVPDDDWMVHMHFQITFNAGGTLTVNNFDLRDECR